MEQKPVVKLFTLHGKMYCRIYQEGKDITESVSKITMTLQKGKVIASAVEKDTK